MALQRKTVPVALQGLDQLKPQQAGVMGKLDSCINMYAQSGISGAQPSTYEFVPRPGVTSLTRTADLGSITTGARLAQLGGQLLQNTGAALYGRASDKWHTIQNAPTPTSVATTPIIATQVVTYASDSVAVRVNSQNFTVDASAFLDPSQASDFVSIRVSDSNGNAMGLPTNIGPAVFAGTIRVVRAVAAGNVVIVFWTDTSAANNIRAVKIDMTSGSPVIGAATTLIATSSGFNFLDVQTTAAGLVALVWNGAFASLQQALLTPSTMAMGSTTTYGIGGDFTTIGYLYNDFASANLFVAHISATLGLRVSTFSSTTLVIGTTTTYDAAIVSGTTITGTTSSGSVAAVYWTAANATHSYDDVIMSSTGLTAVTIRRGLTLASRSSPVSSTGQIFILAKYASVSQPSIYLLEARVAVGLLYGKAMQGTASYDGGVTANFTCLPNLSVVPNSSPPAFLTSARSLISASTGTVSATNFTGSTRIVFVVNDSALGQAVELNGVLNIPGALPCIYDGKTITEFGFVIPNEQSDAYTFGAGGMTASSTYTYRYLYEYADNAGNLYQSAPSAPQQAVLGVGQGSVTHNIPTLRTTMKQGVVLVIERTVANGDGSAYFRTGSVINNTSIDRQFFVDSLSDATLLTRPPLYTDGNVLENLPPPPCSGFAIHRGRLLAYGVQGDKTAVWFSKEIVPAFGIAFNDALVSRLNSSNAQVTAVASMDSYAVAFTDMQTWVSSDEYPDDTGSGGVLKFLQSSSTNGCAGPRLVARVDGGIVAWQAKYEPGPWILDRGLKWTWVGSSIVLDSGVTPLALFAVPSLNQVRVISSVEVFVYETVFNTWATWQYSLLNGALVDAVCIGKVVYYLDATGFAYAESAPTAFADTGTGSPTVVAHSIAMSNLDFAGVAGYQRIYGLQLTGRILGTQGNGEILTLQILQTFDNGQTLLKSYAVNVDTTGLFFGIDIDPGSFGKCSSYAVTIFNAQAGGNNTELGWTLVAVTVDVGIKPSRNRLPPSQRAT